MVTKENNETVSSNFQNAMNGNIRALMEQIDVEPNAINSRDEDQRTLLHWASSGNQLETVKFLLDNNANVNAVDESNWNALHISVKMS
jgi:ankyrin repeat protein